MSPTIKNVKIVEIDFRLAGTLTFSAIKFEFLNTYQGVRAFKFPIIYPPNILGFWGLYLKSPIKKRNLPLFLGNFQDLNYFKLKDFHGE